VGWVSETPSGKFQGGYRDVNNKLHRKNFERKTDAKKWVRDNESAIDRGEWVNPAGPKTPCEEIIDTWLKNKVNEASTLERVASVVKNHIRPYFEGRPIGSVVRSDIQGWVKKKGEVLAPSTVESHYRYVSNIFSTAVKDGVIAKSPCFDIDLPTVVKPRVKPMATEQVEALLNAMPARYRTLVVLGRSLTIVPTAFSPAISVSRMSRRRASPIALKTSEVVEERATAPSYIPISAHVKPGARRSLGAFG
jgi:hypothetical protein